MAVITDILLIFLILFSCPISCNLNVKQLFNKCQKSDLLQYVILPDTTQNYRQLRVECQTVIHLINLQQTQWDKCYISCQAGYSLKNPHFTDLKIATSFFTCRKIKNSNLFHWIYQDGSPQPDMQGCQVDTCPPPTLLRKKYKKSSSSDWEAKFYWVEHNEKFSKIGALVLNLVGIRDNLSNFDFSHGWTLILESNTNISSSQSSSNLHYIHISKALNIHSTEYGRVISFTSNGYNNDIFTSNSIHFANYKRTKFEINFYAGIGQEFNQDFNVKNIYLLEGEKTDVRCHFLEFSDSLAMTSSDSTLINKYGTVAEPITVGLSNQAFQQCHVCKIDN